MLNMKLEGKKRPNKKQCINKLTEATLKEKDNHKSFECPSIMVTIAGVWIWSMYNRAIIWTNDILLRIDSRLIMWSDSLKWTKGLEAVFHFPFKWISPYKFSLHHFQSHNHFSQRIIFYRELEAEGALTNVPKRYSAFPMLTLEA